MSFDSYIERLSRIDKLIQRKATGSPQELAKKLKVSERTVYEYIKEMKRLGAPIGYCSQDSSYVYTDSGHFHFNFIKNKT